MLDKVEHKIMNYLFDRCKGKKSTVLIAPQEILEAIATNPKYEFTTKQLEIRIKNIMLDGYIEVFHSDNKGTLNYVIGLTQKGEAYQREIDDIKAKRVKSLGWKVVLTVFGVAITLLIYEIIGR